MCWSWYKVTVEYSTVNNKSPDISDIQRALADFVFSAIQHAIKDLPWVTLDSAHEPLKDTVIDLIPYSDYQAMVKVTGHGTVFHFEVKVHKDGDHVWCVNTYCVHSAYVTYPSYTYWNVTYSNALTIALFTKPYIQMNSYTDSYYGQWDNTT